MINQFTFILGGARSGKSTYAENLARSAGGKVLYVATATAGDQEMADRIAAHRAARPAQWMTLEAPRQVGQAVIDFTPHPELVLVDCLTLLTSNILLSFPDDTGMEIIQRAVDEEIDRILDAIQTLNVPWIIVSNEVGLGLVPAYPLGRTYRDVLGRANQRLAASAGEVVFMVAGIPMRVKG
jgi:adenosylcobinamide kinase/adenosylcobinamide-phosphate guanylyltransferase